MRNQGHKKIKVVIDVCRTCVPLLVAMKTITVSLSELGFSRASDLAKSHCLPMEAYISAEIADLLENRAPHKEAKASAPPNFDTDPLTLKQVLAVCTYVYEGGVPQDLYETKRRFLDGLVNVAAKFKVTVGTVRDKCTTTRRLGLPDVSVNVDTFLDWLQNPAELRDHLCRKFPSCTDEIENHFKKWIRNS